MLDKSAVNCFPTFEPGDTPWRTDGLREFFLYRDLGVSEATGGRVLCQLVKANPQLPAGAGDGMASAYRGLPHRHHAKGLGPLHVWGQGASGGCR